jgi:hypothetical protein
MLADKSPGFVYTARRRRTIAFYELIAQKPTLHHFYTTDKEEADRVTVQDNYPHVGVICWVIHDLVRSAWLCTLGALVVIVLLEAFLAWLIVANGKQGDTVLQQIIAGWPLLAGLGAVLLLLAGVVIGRERLAALGGRFDRIFRS